MHKIVTAMTLAPSAHNTQPWLFKADTDSIDIFVDWSRHLEVSDPSERQLYMSLGCAIENGVVAAHASGHQVEVRYFPEGKDKNKPVARMLLSNAALTEKPLADAISVRQTNRAIYDGKPLTSQEIQQIPTLTDSQVLSIDDREKIKKIASLTSEGTFTTLARSDFKQELSLWVRSSMTKQHDGMTGDAMGLPGPAAMLAPWLVKIAPIHKQEGPHAKKQVESASLVVVITTPTDTPEEYLKAGRMLERLWLEIAAAGLVASVHMSAIESSAELRDRTKNMLQIDALPQAVVRIGHTKKRYRPTPRRTVEECLKK